MIFTPTFIGSNNFHTSTRTEGVFIKKSPLSKPLSSLRIFLFTSSRTLDALKIPRKIALLESQFSPYTKICTDAFRVFLAPVYAIQFKKNAACY